MNWEPNSSQKGIIAALTAALLFGSGTSLAKGLLADVDPWLLAGLLYLGSGVGLTLYRRLYRLPKVRLQANEWVWLASAHLLLEHNHDEHHQHTRGELIALENPHTHWR
jgi:drug/metabolite transporter (DMT)-like permease